MHSISSSNFFLRPWCTSTPFYSKGARFSVHLSDSSMMDISKRSNFFTDVKKKVVLTCLRLETVSNLYYFWSFTMHPISSSVFFLRPRCTSAPFYCKRASYSVHLSDSSMMDILRRSNFFTDVKKNVVLACLRLETGSNIHYFWSFTMHSISSSNYFSRTWCNSTPFYSKRTRYTVHLSNSSLGDILKRSNIFTDDTKKWFNLSMLRNRLQHLILLKFHHALNISIKLLVAALVHFYSVLVEESMIICSSQRFIHGQNLKRRNFFTDETKKLVLTCLRLETISNI